MAHGVIRYWAAARDAAGVTEEGYDAANLAEALRAARVKHGEQFAKVLTRCSFIVDDAPVGSRDHETVMLSESGTVEVLPPFAGG
ncbi:MAG TPA: MoaD/ThiS family protein [Solirubrobacteraceae bacterium]|nr:MoaD/ThiS family protein [Solirubrobacteraceae bacterium]